MKESLKYVKTRGQRSSNQHVKSQPLVELSFNPIPKSSQSKTSNNSNQVTTIKKSNALSAKKNKKIIKQLSSKQKQKQSKQSKQQIIASINSKPTKSNNVNISSSKKPTLSKTKTKQVKIKLQNIVKKQQIKSVQSQKIVRPKQNNITVKSKSSEKKKLSPKIEQPKMKKSQQKIKEQIQSLPKQNKSTSKASQTVPNHQKGSKSKITMANQDSPSLLNNISIKIEPEISQKKKGRPKKSIDYSRIEQRSFQEQKVLNSFIENAISLRKVKNQRQFFESFSRIVEYLRQSWQYGDLGRKLKKIPHPDDILKIGLQVARGIRKQLQIQALTQPI